MQFSDSAFAEFIAEGEEILQRVSLLLTKSDTQQLSKDDISSLYRDIHTLKGSSQLFGFQAIGLVAHTIEACLEPVRQGKISLDRSLTDIILKCLDFIERILKEPKKDLEKDPQIQSELTKLVPRLIAIATEKFGADFSINKDSSNPEFSLESVQYKHSKKDSENTTNLEILNSDKASETELKKGVSIVSTDSNTVSLETTPQTDKLAATNSVAAPDSSNESSTVRVQVSLLDRLMNLVGEMVLVRNQVLQHAKNSEDNNYLNLTQRLDLVTSELQDQVMRTRMQPIGSVFTKFQRVVRDISRDLGKKIDLKIVGAETELDKSLIEAIKDPMTHIVRNSCDHGIETAVDRKKSGKNEVGTLSLKAFQEGGQVVIEIVDDGRGVDPKKIAAKAIEKGILTAERAAKMSDSEIQFLIFAPGFSTAEKVSSVSGRGVGMDVVRTNIEKVGGNIELISKAGAGTTLRLRIPLTLAIVPAMTIRSAQEFFAIPQVKLQELIRIDTSDKDQKIEILQGQPFYRLRGELLPLVNLKDVMDNKKSSIESSTFNVAVVKSDTSPYGLIVDEICDTADIVVKPLSALLKKLNIFSGATILGDGNVALIIDVQGMAEHTHATRKNLEADKANKRVDSQAAQDKFTDEVGEYLLFKLSEEQTYCVPLTLVSRLEEFSENEIEVTGHERIVQYRGSLLPLISLDEFFKIKLRSETKLSDARRPVIVVARGDKFFGLMVDEIVDILTLASDLNSHLKETQGILGTLITNNKKTTTVIDALSILRQVTGDKTPEAKLIKFKKAKILFAEDTAFFVKQIKKVLEGAGLEVVHVPDGEAALNQIEQNPPGTFSLILSDIEMPKMNGFELATAIRKNSQFAKIPMIAMTTRFRENDIAHGKQVGFNKYLEKLHSDELLNAVGELLGGTA